MSYPYGGGGGYPNQGPGYPAGPAGPAGGGAGYPPAGVGMPQPYGGTADGQGAYPQAGPGLPYAVQPSGIGFEGPPSVAMPNPASASQPTYNTPGQAPAGYPQPGSGYPQPGGAGYPQPGAGYPQPGVGAGYPQAGAGYPQAAAGYPQPGAGQPPAGAGYPQPGAGQPPAGAGYPQPGAGQPPAGAGYPQLDAGQPPVGAGYPQAGAYPQQGGGGASGYPQPSAASSAPPRPAPPTGAMAGLSLSAKPTTQGTIRPHPGFDAESDSKVLRKAMKGLGTDEKTIIDVLCRRTNEQRQQIKLLFKTMHGRDLVSDLKSELGGHFEDAIVGLLMPPRDYDAYCLHQAISGIGTDEDCLVEIMLTRNNSEIKQIRDAYKKLFKRDLEKDLMSDTSGHFKRLMVASCAGGRMENQPVDAAKAQADAQALYSAGEKRLGTDESRFNQILCSQSYEQLRLVFAEYQRIAHKSIEQSIRSEMSGDLEDGMIAIVMCVQSRPAFFARMLYKSMKGAGTKDNQLIRVVVSRSEVDLVQIKEEFQRAYGKTLASFISGDCSGDYKRCLLALIQ